MTLPFKALQTASAPRRAQQLAIFAHTAEEGCLSAGLGIASRYDHSLALRFLVKRVVLPEVRMDLVGLGLPVARTPPAEGIILAIRASALVLSNPLAHLELLLVDSVAVRLEGRRLVETCVPLWNRGWELVRGFAHWKCVAHVLPAEVLISGSHHF